MLINALSPDFVLRFKKKKTRGAVSWMSKAASTTRLAQEENS